MTVFCKRKNRESLFTFQLSIVILPFKYDELFLQRKLFKKQGGSRQKKSVKLKWDLLSTMSRIFSPLVKFWDFLLNSEITTCVTTLLAVKNTQVFTWLFTLTPIYESICVGHSFRKSNTSTKAAGPPSSFFDVIRSSYRANFWLVYKQTWWPEIEIFGQTLVLLLLLQNISHHCWH